MSDRLASELAAARRHLSVEWDEERSQRALERNHRLRRRRRNIRLAAGAVGASAIAVALLVTLRRPEAPMVPPPHAPPIRIAASTPTPAPALERTLADGTRWVPERDGTAMEVQQNSATRVALRLRRGRARVVVPPRPRRDFVLVADEVELRVAGSHFSVERARGQVGVWVEEGQVQVSWPGGADLLHAGRSAWYPLPDEPLPAMTVTADRPRRHRRRHRTRRPTRRTARPEQQTDGAGDLLRAMDLARSRGNPAEAVQLLQAFLRDHASDPRAPLAAFTLGRVHLTQLGEPLQAAQAFARARALAPSGSLAEDALAREVEARARAGDRARARARAQEYLRSYPAGRRAASVRRYAGLE